MILHEQSRPHNDLDNEALQKAVQEHIGMNIYQFISKKHSTYTFKRGRKLWNDGRFILELSPMNVTITKL